MATKDVRVSDHLLKISFTKIAVSTVSLPAISLAYCFFSAFFFRGDEINDTDCNVPNWIPSISAVTGIRPQAYVWRFCIGLHSWPRFFTGLIYLNYYKNSEPFIKANLQGLYRFLMFLCLGLYTTECACLLAVSCISNKENYPIHEKIFVVFMVASIAHMVFGTVLYRWSRHKPMTQAEQRSYFWKKFMTVGICLSTGGLLYFFVQHRFYCIPGAFSYFSAFEYVIAYANMGYHITAYIDFNDKHFVVPMAAAKISTNGAIYVNGSTQPKNGYKKLQ